jgi:hypothetical protein
VGGEPTALRRKSNIVRRLANAKPGAAGVSPPWVGEPDAARRESNIVQRLANAKPGAAGVSPPWFGNTLATAFRLSDRPVVVTSESRFRFCKRGSLTTAGLRQPLLVHDVRSLHKAPFAMHKRTFAGAAGVSPPWVGEPNIVQRESNIVRRLANAQPRAAGVSSPWFGEPHTVPRESNIVRRLANAQPGATGVSPPWFGEPHAVPRKSNIVRRLANT